MFFLYMFSQASVVRAPATYTRAAAPHRVRRKTRALQWRTSSMRSSAANNIRPGMIRQLCAEKADVNVTKGAGMTPLHTAASTGHLGAGLASNTCFDMF